MKTCKRSKIVQLLNNRNRRWKNELSLSAYAELYKHMWLVDAVDNDNSYHDIGMLRELASPVHFKCKCKCQNKLQMYTPDGQQHRQGTTIYSTICKCIVHFLYCIIVVVVFVFVFVVAVVVSR